METKKNYQIGLFVIFCILINYAGKAFAVYAELPLWLDSIGTVMSAYLLGPVCGAIVGAVNNILYGMQNSVSYIYMFTSICIGIIVGVFAKRKFFDTLFQVTSLSVLITMVSVIISTILNVIFYDGMTGNIWGDGVIGYMQEQGYPVILSYVAGEFYIDFLDKLLSLCLIYIMIHLRRYTRKKFKAGNSEKGKKITTIVALLTVLLSVVNIEAPVRADESSDTEQKFTSYVQTIYNSENELPCGEANAIAQTNDGILWIGTYAGLYRYSGSEMRLMDEYESVKNVNCLYVDEEGRLWIGTNDNGISISINENISNVIDDEEGLPSNSVRCIVQGMDGYYYVGTSDSMQILSLNSGLSMIQKIEEINYAISIDANDEGYIATVNENGELFLLKDREIIASDKIDAVQEQYVSCVFDEEGLLYAATSTNHVYVYDISSGEFVKKQDLTCGDLSNINSMYFSEDNILFLCADNGIGYFDEDNRYYSINTNTFNNSIDNMTIDYQGNMWFTSSRMGVLRLCKSSFTDLYSVTGQENKVVNAVEKWQDYLYIGTDAGLDITF